MASFVLCNNLYCIILLCLILFFCLNMIRLRGLVREGLKINIANLDFWLKIGGKGPQGVLARIVILLTF